MVAAAADEKVESARPAMGTMFRVVVYAAGSGDFSPMWSGQAAALGVEMPAGELMRKLASEAQERLR